MAPPTFLSTPPVSRDVSTTRKRSTCARHSRMEAKAQLAQTQKLSIWNEQQRATRKLEAQGPHCPLIDQQLLQHCLLCAKKLKRERMDKEASVQKLLSEARQALGVSNRGKAERLFLRALVVDPGNTKPYFLYALQVQRRDPDLARTLFRTGLSKDPKNAKILQAWGLFESKQGKLDVAQRLLKRSVHLEPLHAPVLKWKVLFPTGEQKEERKLRKDG